MSIDPVYVYIGGPLLTLLSVIVGYFLNGFAAKRNEARARQLSIFYDLMATRAQTLNPRHVEGFNAVPVAFFGKRAIFDRWRECFAHFNNRAISQEAWHIEHARLLSALLVEMAKALGYDFSKADIDAVYSPEGHGHLERDQLAVIQGLATALKSGALAVTVKDGEAK
jgi:hypothetical protein